jgi:hypothetical protein
MVTIFSLELKVVMVILPSFTGFGKTVNSAIAFLPTVALFCPNEIAQKQKKTNSYIK